jgi:hypothetical protein
MSETAGNTLGVTQDLTSVLERIASLPLVTGVHVGVARPAFANQQTTEAKLRPQTREREFDLVIIVEGVGLLEVERDAPLIADLLRAAGTVDLQVHCYDTAYTLERD